MAGVTRVVGLNATAGTLYSVNAKAYLVTIKMLLIQTLIYVQRMMQLMKQLK